MVGIRVWNNCGDKSINILKTISLGGLSPESFLRDYWQKKPLLVRNALPEFEGLLSVDELVDLACLDSVQSRLITRENDTWDVQSDQLALTDFSDLNNKQWTLLVHDVNHYLESARDLLLQFGFVPYARLDDLMVSFSPKGGGIGPHVDSYDVFLLQGQGSKRWQISAQQNHDLIEGIPLKILRDFRAEQEWVLEPGDMLYLPPNYAHNGVAEDSCMTYSIGFRAPSHQEVCEQFLIYLQDHMKIDGRYSDPDLKLQSCPSEIGASMLDKTEIILNTIQWKQDDVEIFLGNYLTEPKPHVFFEPPLNPLSKARFIQQIEKVGVQLDLKSQMLVIKNHFFINGDVHIVSDSSCHILKIFSNDQQLSSCNDIGEEISDLFYQWYLCGYILLINEVN